MIGVESLLFTEPRVGVICGVDEAGRGPLFGDVVAAAVILDPTAPIEGLGDLESRISQPASSIVFLQTSFPLSTTLHRSVAITSSTVCCKGRPNMGAIE